MLSAQTLDDLDRRRVAAWAADCAERVLTLFEAEAPDDVRPRDAIARARAYSSGELDAAGEIRRRFIAGRAAASATTSAGSDAARAAAQAAGVAHMGAHALGAAAFAVRAVRRAHPEGADTAGDAEIAWQIQHASAEVVAALRQLPSLGSDSSGPLGGGMLASGELGAAIRELQTAFAD